MNEANKLISRRIDSTIHQTLIDMSNMAILNLNSFLLYTTIIAKYDLILPKANNAHTQVEIVSKICRNLKKS